MRGWMVALAAASVLTLVPAKAEAGFCGVARYSCCAPCCQMQCHTVMKTVRCVEYEQQERHLLQNVLGPSLRRSGDQLRQVRPRDPLEGSLLHGLQAGLGNQDPLLHGLQAGVGNPTREICYTVCKPVWETKTRCYTVCKPVWETTAKKSATRSASRCGKRKTRCYTVCKPVWETRTRCYTVCKPVWETRLEKSATRSASRCGKTQTRCYTVCKPVWETRIHGAAVGKRRDLLHGLQAGVGNRPAATRCASRCGKPTREVCYHVRVPVNYTKTIMVPSGHWETETYCVPGPVYTQVRPRARLLDVRSVHLPLLLLPRQVPHECAASARRASAARRFGSRRATRKQICCTKYVCEPRTKTCCYKVCKMVPEERTCCYKVCKMVPEQRTRTAATRSARWFPRTPHLLLQGLPDGAGRADLLLQGLQDGARAADLQLQGLQDGARATDPHLLLQGLQDGARATRTCCYKVCKMVPEQRTCTYKVCKMVPEQPALAATRSARWCPSNGPAATRSARWCPSNARTCCYKVCKMVPETADLLLQGLQHGARATDPHGLLHGVQAGVLPEDHPGLEVRAEVRALHGDPLRAALRLQASSGLRLLPELLPLAVACDSCGDGWRRWLRQLRLRLQLTASQELPSHREGSRLVN